MTRKTAVTLDDLADSIAAMDSKIGAMDSKIDRSFVTLDAKIDSSFAILDDKIDSSFAILDAKIDSSFAILDSKIDSNTHMLMDTIKASQDETGGLAADIMTLVDDRFNRLDDKLDNMTFRPFAIRKPKQA